MPFKVGIIGTGWVTGLHVKALKSIPDVTIAAICGRNVAKAKEKVAETGAAVYDHWKPMLAQERLDAVFILLPPHLHGELEEACAQSVKGVLVEKPICADMATAQRCLAAFERAKTIVSVGYMNRYRASVQQARALFSTPEHQPVLVNAWWAGGMPAPLWWRTFAQSGGQFVEQCTHLVDAARYIMGEITQVSAFAARGFIKDTSEFDGDDAMVVNVKFASGAVGNFTTACHMRGFDAIGLKLSSRTAQCTLSGWALNLKLEKTKEQPQELKSQEDIFVVQNTAFIQAVRDNNPALIHSPYADAIRTLRVTLAANESVKTARLISL